MLKPSIKKDRELTNFEIIRHYIDLTELTGVTGLKLNYQINATRRSLKPLYEAYQQDELIPKSVEFKEYEEKLSELYKQLATPEGAKLPKTKNTGNEGEVLDIDTNSDIVVTERIKLQSKYVNSIVERQNQLKEYNNWLQEPCKDDYKLFKVKTSELPDNKKVWDVCTFLIEDEEDTSVEETKEKEEDIEPPKPESRKKVVKK